MKVKADYKEKLKRCAEKSEIMNDFSVEEVETALKLLKKGKATGINGVLPGFLHEREILASKTFLISKK